MRIRTVLCATALATVAAFPLAGVASAQPTTDRDCHDFASQAAAQSALRSQSGDQERLDADQDRIACEEHSTTAQARRGRDGEAPPAQPVGDRDPKPGVGAPPPGGPAHASVKTVPDHQILVKPHGAPDTGDGSAADSAGSAPIPAVLLVGGLGAVGAVGALGARRRAARR